jgi:NADH:ubiquinone oxidoreductase subunit F (NADH-binding)
MRPGDVLEEIDGSGLRGTGGAGFPAARKWRAVADGAAPRFVVANGEEGEPAAWKDRFLLRFRPWRVLEGLAIAMHAVGAETGYVYVSDSVSAISLQKELARGGSLDSVHIEIATVPHTYVAGEETAAIRYLNGGPALPTSKPPRPFEAGVQGRPTLVNNVETLAHAGWICANGRAAFRSVGTDASPGTFLASVSGAVRRPTLTEVPFGTSLAAIVAEAGGPSDSLRGLLLGGYFSGFLPERWLDTPATYEDLAGLGCGLGNGAIVAIGSKSCPVEVIGDLLAFFAHESAGQCGPCVKGTAAMGDILSALRRGEGSTDDLRRLEHYSITLQNRGACRLLDGAALVASRALRFFADELANHLTEPCESCRGRPEADVTGGFAVDDRVIVDGCRDLTLQRN